MRIVQCSKCHRVCGEDDFGEDQRGSAFCNECGSDSYYCIDSKGKRCGLFDHEHVETFPHEFPSLKAYQDYLKQVVT